MGDHVLKAGECPICDASEFEQQRRSIAHLTRQRDELLAALRDLHAHADRVTSEFGFDPEVLASLDRARAAIARAKKVAG